MNSSKLIELLFNIRDKKYKADALQDFDTFKNTLADDLKIDSQESMAMLGYLLTKKYVKMDQTEGLAIDYTSPEMVKILRKGDKA